MCNYEVTVLMVDKDVEEYVIIEANDIKIICFAQICPYPIVVERKYSVIFSLFSFRSIRLIEPLEGSKPTIIQEDGLFRSILIGTVKGNYIHSCGIQFEIDFTSMFEIDFTSIDWSDFDGKIVEVTVDRIHVDFLDMPSCFARSTQG
jgi:hypothetical protein